MRESPHPRASPSYAQNRAAEGTRKPPAPETEQEHTHQHHQRKHRDQHTSKRHRRHNAFKTGSWSYKDRMLFVGSLQRDIDFIALGQEMRRDVDDVFEKFSDVLAAGLY